ncbi:hypothetical protein B1C78_09825 [Thioalkalivibrio denitrificans]|uniref:Uncharacterized protein n=1 Tax=Thioalkalivibrio denitrificans TaxID=108003 RepID=A0A1V3NG46_9GAMM|nr:hypothetical protein B1C78_09825 [Thioalkalivibrio denitrificans]
MGMTNEEQEAVVEILDVLYDNHASNIGFRPTEQTIHELENLLLEMQECDKQLRTLIKALPCSTLARGSLRRCLISLARTLRQNRSTVSVFCYNARRWQYRTRIFDSGAH